MAIPVATRPIATGTTQIIVLTCIHKSVTTFMLR